MDSEYTNAAAKLIERLRRHGPSKPHEPTDAAAIALPERVVINQPTNCTIIIAAQPPGDKPS